MTSARADGDQRDGQRGDEPPAVEPHGHPVGVVLLRRRQDLAGEPEDGVLLVVLVAAVAAAAGLHPGGVEEDRAEQVEDPAEVLDGRGADQDEDGAQHERERDAEQQHLLLQLPRHGEARHDQHEDEEVVDRQALLGDVAGEVLAGVLGPGEPQDQQPEDDGDADVDRRPDRGLTERRRVRRAHVADEIEDQHPDDRGDRESPDEERDIHAATSLRLLASVSTGGLSRRRRQACDRQRRRSWDLVMTTLPRGILPSTFGRRPCCDGVRGPP